MYVYAGNYGKEHYIPLPVHLIANKIDPAVFEYLSAMQPLTMCDTTCSMNRIGKKTAYSIGEKYRHARKIT